MILTCSNEQAIRQATKKQHGAAILMETLCMSVPSDPAFVLEVHRDVLKTRLRCATLCKTYIHAALSGVLVTGLFMLYPAHGVDVIATAGCIVKLR